MSNIVAEDAVSVILPAINAGNGTTVPSARRRSSAGNGAATVPSARRRSSAGNGAATVPAARRRSSGVLASQFLQLPPASVCASSISDNTLARRDTTSFVQASDRAVVSQQIACCCCNLNTKVAVYSASIFGHSLNSAGFLFYCARGQYLYSLPALVLALLFLSTIFAQIRQKSSYFIPFLFANSVFIVLRACLALFLAIMLIWLPDWCVTTIQEYFEWDEFDHAFFGKGPKGHQLEQTKVRLFIGASLALTVVYILVECWIWWIMFRGFKAASHQRAAEWLDNLNKNIRSVSIY